MIMKSILGARACLAGLTAVVLLAACGGVKEGDYYPEDAAGTGQSEMRVEGTAPEPGLLAGAFSLGNLSTNKPAVGGLGVNGFLWRATLDTLSFMPLATADPIGGVIITDWHANPAVPSERFKLTVYILDTRLRADGVKVSVFRQEQGPGGWQDATVSSSTAVQLENQILRRARELKVSTSN